MRVLILFDGIMGAAVAPSIAERIWIVTPVHILALLFSEMSALLVLKEMQAVEFEFGKMANDPWQVIELVREHAPLGAVHAISFAITVGVAVFQLVCHKYRREQWLKERARAQATAQFAALQKPAVAKRPETRHETMGSDSHLLEGKDKDSGDYWDRLDDGYFSPAELVVLGPRVRLECQRFESSAVKVDGVDDADGDLLDFFCGKALDHGVTRASTGPQRLVVAMNGVTGQLMACLKHPLASIGSAQAHRIVSEVRVLKKFRHRNIVEYKGACVRDGHVHILMELCDFGSIASIVLRFGALDESLAARYTQQMLSGLSYLHRHCIVHKHVTCSSSLVTSTGHVKLADFGAIHSKLDTSEKAPSQHVKFPAPELLVFSKHVRQSDIWSVGCCLLEMLTAQEANELKQASNPRCDGSVEKKALRAEHTDTGFGHGVFGWMFLNTERIDDRHEDRGEIATEVSQCKMLAQPDRDSSDGLVANAMQQEADRAMQRTGGPRTPTIPATLGQDAKEFLEACLQEDYSQRPNAMRLLEYALMSPHTHHDPNPATELQNSRTCTLPQSVQAPFSLFRWLYDLEELDLDEDQVTIRTRSESAYSWKRAVHEATRVGRMPLIAELGRRCFRLEMWVNGFSGRFRSLQDDLAFQRFCANRSMQRLHSFAHLGLMFYFMTCGSWLIAGENGRRSWPACLPVQLDPTSPVFLYQLLLFAIMAIVVLSPAPEV